MTRTLMTTLAALSLALSGCATETAPETGKSAQALTAETVEAVALVGQVAADLEGLTEADSAEGPAPAGDDEGASAACTAVDWNILTPLRVGLVFTNCVTASGELVNGQATAWLSYDGVDGQVGVQIDELAVGQKRLDGFLVVASDGPDAILVDTDVHYADLDAAVDVRVTLAARIDTSSGAPVLDGAGTFASDGEVWTASASALRFGDPASCLPTSGSLDIDAPTLPVIEVVFADGTMGVTVGGFPVPPPTLACQ
jgi:hypothetical protein